MEKFSYLWCLITNNEHCKLKQKNSGVRCAQHLDARKMGFHNTEVQTQTNSSAEGLIYRHLPSSPLPSTPSVEKTFIDLYCTGDSWNPKKWCRSFRNAHSAAMLVSHSYRAGSQHDRGKELHKRLCTQTHHPHHTLPTHLHLSKQGQQSPSGCQAHLTPSVSQKRKAMYGDGRSRVETGIWVFKKQT